MDLISAERDLLTQYTDSFNVSQSAVMDKYQAVVKRLEDSTKSENDETAALVQLQKQLDNLSLTATLEKFNNVKVDLTQKFQNYTKLVQDNNTLAASIYQNLQGTKNLVAEITAVISEIDANISQINTTIDTYSAVSNGSSSVASAPVVVASVPTDSAEESSGAIPEVDTVIGEGDQ